MHESQLDFLAKNVGKLAYSLAVSFSPVSGGLDMVSCKAIRLPTSLDSPGFLENGQLTYAEEVLLDLYTGS